MQQAWNEKNVLDKDFAIRLIFPESGFSFQHHWHKEVELIYVIEGNLEVGINDNIYELEIGDILLISPCNVHYFPVQYNKWKIVIIQFELTLFNSFSTDYYKNETIKSILLKTKKSDQDTSYNINENLKKEILIIIDEYNTKNKAYKMLIKAKLDELIVILLRNIPTEAYSLQEKSRLTGKLERLVRVFEYVEINYENPIALEDVARVANFSEFYFTRFFKKCIGMTFMNYLNNFRVTKAEWYLKNNDISITEVADKSGFENIKTFDRVFRKLKNCSPRQYRKNNI